MSVVDNQILNHHNRDYKIIVAAEISNPLRVGISIQSVFNNIILRFSVLSVPLASYIATSNQ